MLDNNFKIAPSYILYDVNSIESRSPNLSRCRKTIDRLMEYSDKLDDYSRRLSEKIESIKNNEA